MFRFWSCRRFRYLQVTLKRFSSELYPQPAKTPSTERWEENVKSWMKRYEDIFGISKLSEMHDKVLQVQFKVQEAQERRRKVQEDMLNVQQNLQEIQAKLEKIPRGDDMFLSVVTQEHELLKDQKRLQNLLAVFDRTEREEQTALALAINMSQDHERTYREKNKYLSLIAGVVGGLIGVIGSSINNWRHRKDIRLFASDITSLIKEQNGLTPLEADVSYMDAFRETNQLLKDVQKLFSNQSDTRRTIEDQTNALLSCVNTQEQALSKLIDDINVFTTPDGRNNQESLFTELLERRILNEIDQKTDRKIKTQIQRSVLFSTALIISSFIIYAVYK